MSFADSISTCLRRYADFAGRAPRSEYWWFVLFGLLVSIATSILDRAAGTIFIQPLAVLALFVPNLAVACRRLHDVGRSGWWILLPYGTLFAGLFIAIGAMTAAANNPEMTGSAFIAILVSLVVMFSGGIILLVWTLTGSQPGDNQYGPNPFGLGGPGPEAGSPGYYMPPVAPPPAMPPAPPVAPPGPDA